MFDLYVYFSLFLICLISSIFISILFKSTSSKHRLPPSPFGYLPIIGHLHLLGSTPHQAFHKMSLRYGPVFRVFLGSVPCIVACSPEIAKEILKTHESDFLDRPQNSAVTYLSYESKGILFAPYGQYLKFMKKIVMSKLLNRTTIDLFYPVRYDEIIHFIKYLSQNAKLGQAVNLEEELMKMFVNMLTRILMSERYSDDDIEAAKMRKVINEIAETMGNFNPSDYIWLFKSLDLQGFGKRVQDIRRRFDFLIERVIKTHEEARNSGVGSNVKDFLDNYLEIAKDEIMEVKLTREHIKAFILDIITAGTDTTAVTVEWALAELINHPKVLEKAREEIDRIVGKNRLIQDIDINNLPYLDAIVKETLRLHPSVPLIPRKSTRDCIVAGYHIQANATVFVNAWAINRDPNHWENSLEFKPERFQENELDIRGQDFQMLPFGSGRRVCPGISLAMQLVPMILGMMVQCFEWKAGKMGILRVLIWTRDLGYRSPNFTLWFVFLSLDLIQSHYQLVFKQVV